LTISGSGTTTLSASNTYTGQTYINGSGVVSISANGNLGAPATGAQININGGTLKATATFSLDNSGANKRAVSLIDNGGTFDVTGSNNLTISGVISAITYDAQNTSATIGLPGLTDGLTKIDSGTLTLTGANTYIGNTYGSVQKYCNTDID